MVDLQVELLIHIHRTVTSQHSPECRAADTQEITMIVGIPPLHRQCM